MDSEDKIAALREMLDEDPVDHLGWYMLGRELIRAGRHAEAAEALERIIPLDENYTAAYRELGVAYEKSGQLDKAKKIYQRGIDVAEKTRDLQTQKEMRVFLKRVKKKEG